MSKTIEKLADQLSNSPDFIVGKYIDTNEAIEVFTKNPNLKVSEVMGVLKKTGLKITKSENKKFTLTVSEWKEHDCHRCGVAMNSIENKGQIKYFCPQCVMFN